MKALVASGEHGLMKIVMMLHAGNTTDAFEQIVNDWLAVAKHPRFNKPYTDLVFSAYAGIIEFMRPWGRGVYGIPND